MDKNNSSYKKETAEAKMSNLVPTVRKEMTLGQVEEKMFEQAADWETMNYIYVLDDEKRLVGVFSIDLIFRLPTETKVEKIMKRDLKTCQPNTDQEMVVRIALKSNIKAVPVVNREGKFLGVVPSDHILEILNQEHGEDLMRLSGITGSEEDGDSGGIIKSLFSRIPWILIGLFGGLITAKVIVSFETTMQREVALAAFIPLVVYLANAIGVQVQTLYIRRLALRPEASFWHYSGKQIMISVLIGLVCAGVIWGLVHLGLGGNLVAVIVSSAVIISALMAAIVALLIPYSLSKLKIDPAIASGPFATIIQDLLAVIIYFEIAKRFLA